MLEEIRKHFLQYMKQHAKWFIVIGLIIAYAVFSTSMYAALEWVETEVTFLTVIVAALIIGYAVWIASKKSLVTKHARYLVLSISVLVSCYAVLNDDAALEWVESRIALLTLIPALFIVCVLTASKKRGADDPSVARDAQTEANGSHDPRPEAPPRVCKRDLTKVVAAWVEGNIPLLTLLAVLVAAYTVWSASKDAETQRFNTAWMLVNSSNNNSPPSANRGQVDGGGRKTALDYLRENHQSLQGADLSQAILSYAILDGMDLNRTNMTYTDLFGSDLRAASLWSVIMTDANLQFAQLQGADLHHADLQCADLRGAHLEQLPRDKYLRSKRLIIDRIRETLGLTQSHTIEGRVKNEYVTLRAQRWVPTNLTGVDLSFAHLEGADLTKARLVNATLENAHLDSYKDKFSTTGGCRRGGGGLLGLYWHNPDKQPSRGEIFDWTSTHNARQPNLSFPATNLTDADLTGAILTNADLRGAILRGADLTGAIGITDKQIDVAKGLCNTILPSYMDHKKGNRDCPQNTFAADHADIKTLCAKKRSTVIASCINVECWDDAVDEYRGCLGTHSQAIETQDYIYDAKAETTVSVNTLEQNPVLLEGKTIAVVGFNDKVVSRNESILVGMRQHGRIISTYEQMDTSKPGRCVVVGTVHGNKVIPNSSKVSVPNIDVTQHPRCTLSE